MILQRMHKNRSKRKTIAQASYFPISGGMIAANGIGDPSPEWHVDITLDSSEEGSGEYFRVKFDPEEAIRYGKRMVELGEQYLAAKQRFEERRAAGMSLNEALK